MRSKNFWLVNGIYSRGILAVALAVLIGACSGPDDSLIDEQGSGKVTESVPPLTHPVTVSGLSSGAYMAIQTHLALDRVTGIGVVAGGPYHCAADSVGNALGRCMSGEDLDIAPLISFAKEAAASGSIAPLEYLRDARVWLFHSNRDAVVQPGVLTALTGFYREFVPADQISVIDSVEAAHGWPTLEAGGECLEISGDFINACDFDAAGSLLNHLYENLNPRVAPFAKENLLSMELSGYFESGSSVADMGYLYVPETCRESDSGCRLHIAYHGCRQGAEFVGDRFAANSGLNEWATQNQLVIVYPQIRSSMMNPLGCWDWWGYTGSQYDQKSGKQISGINALITAFSRHQLF